MAGKGGGRRGRSLLIADIVQLTPLVQLKLRILGVGRS